jgi:N-acetylneuraminate synthase
MDRPGPDIICSMDELACKELIEGSTIILQQRGGKKGPAEEEKLTIDFAFATFCMIRPVQAGDVFSKENIWVKRTGKGGILAGHYEEVLGKMSKKDLENDIQVIWDDIDYEKNSVPYRHQG